MLTAYSEFMAAFCPAACQYFTAIGGLHTLAKTMYGFTTAFMRLVGSFFTRHNVNFFLLQNVVAFLKTGHHPRFL